mmetsp:Transcript_12313/g.39173  ORF Transcript_12313/g.39173 Transcript_12313/m.39173 type:complete len:233 (+) Transcript_12313:129-827(+)
MGRGFLPSFLPSSSVAPLPGEHRMFVSIESAAKGGLVTEVEGRQREGGEVGASVLGGVERGRESEWQKRECHDSLCVSRAGERARRASEGRVSAWSIRREVGPGVEEGGAEGVGVGALLDGAVEADGGVELAIGEGAVGGDGEEDVGIVSLEEGPGEVGAAAEVLAEVLVEEAGDDGGRGVGEGGEDGVDEAVGLGEGLDGGVREGGGEPFPEEGEGHEGVVEDEYARGRGE